MPTISTQQLQQLGQTLNGLSPSAGSDTVNATLSNIYSTLQDAGFSYAGWANGVVNQNTVTGLAAMQFLTGTAMMGLGSLQCKDLTPLQLDKLKIDMAKEYLVHLSDISNESDFVERDITAQEAWDMHKNAYEASGLPINSWTLDSVFKTIVAEYGGLEALESFWKRMRDTEGDGIDAINESIAARVIMLNRSLYAVDPEIRKLAEEWLKHAPGLDEKSWKIIESWVKNNGPSSIKEIFESLPAIPFPLDMEWLPSIWYPERLPFPEEYPQCTPAKKMGKLPCRGLHRCAPRLGSTIAILSPAPPQPSVTP